MPTPVRCAAIDEATLKLEATLEGAQVWTPAPGRWPLKLERRCSESGLTLLGVDWDTITWDDFERALTAYRDREYLQKSAQHG